MRTALAVVTLLSVGTAPVVVAQQSPSGPPSAASAEAPLGPPAPTPAPSEYSRLDRFNIFSDNFNFWMLQHVVKPLSKAYNVLIPKLLQTGIGNALLNASRPRDVINSLLQGRFERSGRHLAALVINTTVGVGGLLYVSDRVLEDDSPETFNETLGVWGVPTGPYLVLPLIIPPFVDTSPRLLLGAAGDVAMNPLFWIPGLAGTLVGIGVRGTDGLNAIASLMPEPWASQSEWDAFEEIFTQRTPYLEQKKLFFENQRLDVEY